MKIGLKILHKVPDLDKLAAKHQNFDALLDTYTDEKISKRKKFYKAGSFVSVILVTAFLSWLYWEYEPVTTDALMPQAKLPKDSTTEVLPVEEKESNIKDASKITNERPSEAKIVTKESIEGSKSEPEMVRPLTTPEPEEVQKVEIASPMVATRQLITSDATPTDGLENLYRYLYSEINLPDSLLRADNSLFLEVEFEVNTKGEIKDISFNKVLPETLKSELKKVFAEMPTWTPALEKGDTISSIISLPITFQKKGGK